MWEYEYSAETTASPEAIWAVWSDVESWGRWNPGIESVTIDGRFQAGSAITMTPPGEEAVQLRITRAVPNQVFVDEAEFGGVVVTTEHRIERSGPGRRTAVTYRMLISGPGATEVGPEIGPQITADFPETVAGLIACAEA
jgi:uncharacterized protein YndB with AHSA1/START domain